MAKTRTTSAKSGESSGKVPAKGRPKPKDPVQVALEKMGRKPHPLTPPTVLEHEAVLDCKAVTERAGVGASPDQRAIAACDLIRDIVAQIRDDNDRHVAEVALATAKEYEGEPINKRQDVLLKKYHVTRYMYAERRPAIFHTIAYELRNYRASSPNLVRLHPEQVGIAAIRFFYAAFYSRLLIQDRPRMFGEDAPLVREPNWLLYHSFVTFLLIGHRYLHTIDPIEDVAKPELEAIFQQIINLGPLNDIVYLAHIYGGRDVPYYSPDDPNGESHRLLYLSWDNWYKDQEKSGVGMGSDLHLLSLACLEFRNSLPRIGKHQFPAPAYSSNEHEVADKIMNAIMAQAFRRSPEPTQSPVLADIVGDEPQAQESYQSAIDISLLPRMKYEYGGVGTKEWDDLIAERLHSRS